MGEGVYDWARNYYHAVQACCAVAVTAYKLLILRLEGGVCPASGFGRLKWGKVLLIPSEQETWCASGSVLMF